MHAQNRCFFSDFLTDDTPRHMHVKLYFNRLTISSNGRIKLHHFHICFTHNKLVIDVLAVWFQYCNNIYHEIKVELGRSHSENANRHMDHHSNQPRNIHRRPTGRPTKRWGDDIMNYAWAVWTKDATYIDMWKCPAKNTVYINKDTSIVSRPTSLATRSGYVMTFLPRTDVPPWGLVPLISIFLLAAFSQCHSCNIICSQQTKRTLFNSDEASK